MKHPVRTFVTTALALALAACGMSPEERLDRAEQAMAEHRYSEARLDLGTLLQEDASDPQVLELMARTQLQLGDGAGAHAMLERLEATGTTPDDFTLLLAEAMLLQGEFEGALAAGESLGTAEGLRVAALAHLRQGGVDLAEQTFARGQQAPGDRSRLLADYARFVHLQGDSERGMQLAQQALALDPQGLDPLVAAAMIHQDTGEFDEALALYETAQSVWPESRAAMLGRIGSMGDSGRVDEIRPLIEEAANRFPGDPEVTFLQARLLAEDGEWGEVRNVLQADADTNDPRRQLLYARALVELDLPEQALPRLNALNRQIPGNPEIEGLLARAEQAASAG